VRLFFALWPPAATAQALADWAREVSASSGGRVSATENIHLTLAFLGAVETEKALQAGQRVMAQRHALPIETARYWKHNRIVWVGPRELPAPLKALVEALQLELFREEFMLERRPFAAHVTLLRNAPLPRELSPLPEVEWPVHEFTLVRSTVSSKGSVYEVVERFPLRP